MNIKKWNIKKIEIKNVLSSQYLKKKQKKIEKLQRSGKRKKKNHMLLWLPFVKIFLFKKINKNDEIIGLVKVKIYIYIW